MQAASSKPSVSMRRRTIRPVACHNKDSILRTSPSVTSVHVCRSLVGFHDCLMPWSTSLMIDSIAT